MVLLSIVNVVLLVAVVILASWRGPTRLTTACIIATALNTMALAILVVRAEDSALWLRYFAAYAFVGFCAVSADVLSDMDTGGDFAERPWMPAGVRAFAAVAVFTAPVLLPAGVLL